MEGFRGIGCQPSNCFEPENPKDQIAAEALIDRLSSIEPSRSDGETPDRPAIPAAIVTDMPAVEQIARKTTVEVFGFEDIKAIAAFLRKRYTRAPLTIAIQAGGESKRMGQSKALTPFLGRPLIEHMLEVVASFADELIVTTNEEPELRYLLERHPKLRLVSDVMEERGALPGLLTAIEASSNDAVGVVACDMIAFSPQFLPARLLQMRQMEAMRWCHSITGITNHLQRCTAKARASLF